MGPNLERARAVMKHDAQLDLTFISIRHGQVGLSVRHGGRTTDEFTVRSRKRLNIFGFLLIDS